MHSLTAQFTKVLTVAYGKTNDLAQIEQFSGGSSPGEMRKCILKIVGDHQRFYIDPLTPTAVAHEIVRHFSIFTE